MANVQIDDQFDMFGGFVAEIEGYLPVVAANVRQLLLTPGDEALLEESHRFAHTIKSSAAMMGIPELRRVAAPMEVLLARAYANEVMIDDAVVATIDGTLTRIRACLTLRQAGGDLDTVVKENDQAYATLRPVAPGQQRAVGEDARDRLLHADLPMPLALLPVGTLDVDREDASPPSSVGLEEDLAAAMVASVSSPPDAGEVALAVSSVALDLADNDGEGTVDEPSPLPDVSSRGGNEQWSSLPAERPRLTVLAGGTIAGTPAPNLPMTQSIAAEWLAEVLGELPAEVALPAAPRTSTSDVPTTLDVAVVAADLQALRQQWEQRLAGERSAWEAQLERERQASLTLMERERLAYVEQRQALLNEHDKVLRTAEEAHERALQEQREALEREVQRYVEEDLRPQLEDEIRDELTHEFEVAALLDPSPQVVESPRPSAAPAYAFVEDAALAAEMRDIFAQEAAEHIQAIGEHTLALRLQPDDPEHMQGLRRSVHTLKGASATVGLTTVSILCHQIENALDRQLEGGTVADAPSQNLLLLESCDALESLVRGDDAAVEQARTLADRLSLLTGIPIPLPETAEQAGSDSGPVVEARPAASQEPPFVLPPDPASFVVHDVPADVAASTPTPPAGLAIRVSLTELDRLLAANHELIITESALELRLQRLQRTLGDVRHTGDRLRAAGSRLESVRSFASLLAGTSSADGAASASPALDPAALPTWRDALRRQAAAPAAGEFDSLELDRYTEYHRLTREVSEAALDVTTSDAEIGDVLDDLRLTLKQQQRLHALQNEVLLHARMVPVHMVLPRLARAVQAVAAQQGKQVEFVVDGQDTLIDRAVMEEVADALLHLVRNAVDHGMELPDDRLRTGKAAQGTIRLAARRVGPEIVLTLTDDGPGLDTAAILRAATARGLVSETSRLTEHEIQQLIFSPGLSTAEVVTDISGRGVGLDVVRANVQALRGEVELASQLGVGTTFTLKVPISLALLTVALVEAAGSMYAIPLTLVRHVEKVAARRIHTEDDGQFVRHGGRTYRVIDLATLLGRPPTAAAGTASRPLVFVGSGQGTLALAVDQLAGKREVVVKDLGRQLQSVRGLHGAAALGNGDLALILDVPALLQQEGVSPRRPIAAAPSVRRQRQLLVVDDSPSVRRLTCAVFERQGWQVRPARDGVEALDVLQGWRPDAVVMDIEMPRMDGFELLAILRRQPETASVPAVMVTSRAGDKHREKAIRLGIDAYLVKPFREEELLTTVDGLLLQSSATVPASTR